MKFIFLVQGEGRGHLTQAISLKNMLIRNGHKISTVIVGKSKRRVIPSFFYQDIDCRIVEVESPNFIVGKDKKKIKIFHSIMYNIFRFYRFAFSIQQIRRIVKNDQPDAIINFYDILGGLFNLFSKNGIPSYCIGHQYLTLHPAFIFPQGNRVDRTLLKLHTRITAIRANKLLALSFREMPSIPGKRIYVVPPLLREKVLDKTPSKEGFIHGYILNQGYADEIVEWHKKNAHVKANFFWDKPDASAETLIHRNLIFHQINDKKFLDYMSRCSGYATTAGFESVCEAMYLGKPILMVPTAGHYEQKCNALDAAFSGAGIIDSKFDLSRLLDYIPNHVNRNIKFKSWVMKAEEIHVSILTAGLFEIFFMKDTRTERTYSNSIRPDHFERISLSEI